MNLVHKQVAADQLELVIVSLSSDNLGNGLLLFVVRVVHGKQLCSCSTVRFQLRKHFCP